MKKTVALILCLMLAFALASCSSVEKTGTTALPSDTVAPSDTDGATESGAATTVPDGGKTLVVYFSASGNTERVAKALASATGADLFEIVPAEVYTDDDLNWTNSDSRVCREHDDESLRDVALTTTAVDGWENYDTVYIGYPIWWGIAAWPVNGFVKANDFSGKTVIPFATSSSSGMGSSGEILAELAGSGNWQEGHRFSSGASDSDVAAWALNK